FIAQGEPLGVRLHRLTPGEAIWRPSGGGLPAEAISDNGPAHDPVSGNYFITIPLGSVYVSTDDGNNWSPRVNGLGGIGSPSSIVHVGETALTSRPLAGVLKTEDQGLNWSASRSFGQDSIGNMIVQDGRLLIVAGRALHFSDDEGASWHQIDEVPHGNSVLSGEDRKSTRLNSSHVKISYAVFCLKKKTTRNGTGVEQEWRKMGLCDAPFSQSKTTNGRIGVAKMCRPGQLDEESARVQSAAGALRL